MPPRAENTNSFTTKTPKKATFIQYHGKCTGEYARSIHRINVPSFIFMTMRKLKIITTLPSLKPTIQKYLRSDTVYKIECACCKDIYVGQTRQTAIQVNINPHINITRSRTSSDIGCMNWKFIIVDIQLFILIG